MAQTFIQCAARHRLDTQRPPLVSFLFFTVLDLTRLISPTPSVSKWDEVGSKGTLAWPQAWQSLLRLYAQGTALIAMVPPSGNRGPLKGMEAEQRPVVVRLVVHPFVLAQQRTR